MAVSKPSIGHGDSGGQAASRAFRFTMSFLAVLLVATVASQFTSLFGAKPNGVMSDVWPQSWTFFRTASTAALTVAYRIDERGTLTLLTEREATGRELWGLRRGIYVQRAEIALLSTAVTEERWFECEDIRCVDEITATDPIPAVNTAGAPTLCGHIALMRVRPGALELGDPVDLSGRLVRGVALEVTCERG